MFLTFGEICEKEVINLPDGTSFGYATDLLTDTKTGKIMAIIIGGKQKFFGIIGREEALSISWDKIENIGKDAILVKTERKSFIKDEKINFFQKILNIFLY
ncbi:MAG: YlmC/YmxH family sporulation protein [Oscillospiraceae bacterium]|nr:YlmC/YmxH family sporulation protein [Oscillospiraceae bacterium]